VEGHGLAWSFAPLKFVATLASTLSGIPGGLFAPSLSIGAGMGSIIATHPPEIRLTPGGEAVAGRVRDPREVQIWQIWGIHQVDSELARRYDCKSQTT